MEALLPLLLNKFVLGSLAAIIALIAAYFKGSAAANKAAEAKRIYDEQALQSRIRAAEAKNQHLEKRGAKNNEAINNSDTIADLIQLFDSLQRKDKDGSSDKNPKWRCDFYSLLSKPSMSRQTEF